MAFLINLPYCVFAGFRATTILLLLIETATGVNQNNFVKNVRMRGEVFFHELALILFWTDAQVRAVVATDSVHGHCADSLACKGVENFPDLFFHVIDIVYSPDSVVNADEAPGFASSD